ncbi:NAD(P)-dependent dehydrogenase, short-chain alcohol dehydrogenase family [Paracoccus isoporae]|uniref:NAD(P)-dependent dehydrogenase, short-chain alcohol dehydrogenase family n=1 Tax=Paracoccus isoporae TaxID=591205 RepID=A0A1G6XSJ5_9RHOB|nr:SDR family NAD(P)-dependent oxidoreductase [Paracoccus isoporae]SDD80693.1 NAD(P)-dependent dehydrogenase, short-chain alcohol dehydrogenase family [Paracoccus isoporae]
MRIVITGANRGIGAGLKSAYTMRGEEVLGTSREPSGDLIGCDVTDPASVASMAEAVGDGPVDLLICNAGVYLDKGAPLDGGYDARLFQDSFAVNATGVFLTIEALLPAIRQSRGRIAIISSAMGSDWRAPGGSLAYRASKAAALNIDRNLATDLRPEGVAVGIYHPGWVRTRMGSEAADISVDEAVSGLVERFSALSMETTGVFESYDGQTLKF